MKGGQAMELQTITQISKLFGISTRTLRYYEQIGLIQSIKKEDYAYRVYDEDTVLRLQKIIVLRKLRIPLKQIIGILMSEDNTMAINVFQQNLFEIEDEITALSTIRNIIQTLLERLHLQKDMLRLLDDESLLEIVDSLTVSKINFKEDKTMEDLNKASEKLSKLTDSDVRIVYLPSATIAAYQFEGDEPERIVGEAIRKFVRESNLLNVKPDVRHYGFNAPNPYDETGKHGYEMQVTIPDNMEVPEPLVKKHFEGGLYAAHMIPFGAFEQWEWLNEWVTNSSKYDYRGNWDGVDMFGWIEEHLNYYNHALLDNDEPEGMQLDLLIPIKERN